MAEVFDACRWLNQYLGALAAVGVAYRLTLMALDRRRWRDERALHLLAWFVYIMLALLVASLGAAHYVDGPTPASWTSAARTALTVMALVLCVWWPHPPRFVPIEGDAAR